MTDPETYNSPWSIRTDSFGGAYLYDRKNYLLARMWPEANTTSLIAAAPQLLLAAEAALEYLTHNEHPAVDPQVDSYLGVKHILANAIIAATRVK